MNIPAELLIDYMDYLNPEVLLEQRDLWLSGVKLMPDNGYVDPDFLYFCGEEALTEAETGAPVVYVCGKSFQTSLCPKNCIILRTEVSLSQVFNDVLGWQNLLRSWEQKLELSLSGHEGIQRMLDLSAGLFGTPMAVITSDYQTAAATWEQETEDRMFWELLELGHLTRETFQLFRDHGYFKPEDYSGETVVYPPDEVQGFTSVLTAVTKENAGGYLLLMLCSNTPYTRGLRQIYAYFAEKLRLYLHPITETESWVSGQYDRFILDIVEGRVTSLREITERSLAYPPAYSNQYNTVLISHEGSSSMYLEHAAQNLSALFSNLRPIQYGQSILLHPNLRESKARRESFFATLEDYLEISGGYAGVSESFTGLEMMGESCRQAREALRLGRRLMRTETADAMLGAIEEGKRFFRFEDVHVYSALSGGETDTGVLEQIRRYDQEHKTEYYRMLFVLLSLERSFTKAAAVLHMHRNNVIYHAKRMEEIFDIDLDDPNQRLRLLMLYKLGDLLRSR